MRLARVLVAIAVVVTAGCGDDDGGANNQNNTNQNNTNGNGICGDEHLDPGEQCDLGSANSDSEPNTCRTDCRTPYCGDGVTDDGEQCDDGNADNNDGCVAGCLLNVCGDGYVNETQDGTHPAERCDDGNTDDGDDCRGDCLQDMTLCGNGTQDPEEQCDNGGQNSDTEPDACRTNCRLAGCGDGAVDGDEACDDGYQNSDTEPDACRTDCLRAHCGDGVADSGEACDGADLNGQTCTSLGVPTGTLACLGDCTWDFSGCPGCGNGILESGEQCDDATQNSDTVADACRTDCLRAHCGDGVIDNGEQCDDGAQNSDTEPDACRPVTCQLAGCGDGVIDNGEQCDDGAGNSDTEPNACRTDCTQPGCGDGVVDTGEQCEDGNASDWDGCTSCDITEFQVNTTTVGFQDGPSVAMTADGTSVVVWSSPDGDAVGVYAQRYSSDGTVAGSEFQVNTYVTNSQYSPAVAMASDGAFVVVWVSYGQDGDEYGIFAQRYNASGAPVGSEFQVNTYTTDWQDFPAVAMASDGRFVVAWESYGQDGDGWGVFGQRYDASGAPVGSEFQVNTYTTNEQAAPAVAMASDGAFVVAWVSHGQDGDVYGIFAQRYNASGAAVGGEFQVNTYTTSGQFSQAVAMASDGAFVVAWVSDDQDGDGFGIFAQRYDASGAALGGEFQVNTYTTNWQEYPAVAMAPDGRFVVVWDSYGQDGDGWGVFAQRYNASGAAVGGEFQVNTYTTNDQEIPAVAMASDGRFVVAWFSYGQDGDGWDVFAQRYDASGNALGLLPW